jgi:adenine phosphoribosyltransferase
MLSEKILKSLLRDVPDFPKPGIVFKDITPVLANPAARREVSEALAEHFRKERIDAVAGVEARGFIFGMLLAEALNVPFIPVRKSGKLPFRKIQHEYSLEYGTATLEMHEDAVQPGARILIHDDLLATGGTAAAAAFMIQELKGVVAGFSFIIHLAYLSGEQLLIEKFSVKPHYLVSYS